MRIKPHPTKSVLRHFFDYSEDAYVKSDVEFVGGLVWRPRVDKLGRANTREVGQFAGFANAPQRRVNVQVDGGRYELHRLVWIWHFGDLGQSLVDHKSRDTTDNRIANLRRSTHSGNNSNRSPSVGRSSQYIGVYLHRRGFWCAQIKKDRKVIYLGSYATEEQAARARDEATRKIHGEYGVLNFAQEK